ncbi:MAG: dephospho-CoA kinase [Phycisphaeraceae bacterium]|nr:dephospho-CoA kinase [Phycisphaeraceae bacterium]
MSRTHSNQNAHRKPVIGIIGGVGSGKSTVARLFASLGCAVIDADVLAHEALASEPVKREIVRWWGDDVLKADGSVNRQAVGKIVFADNAELARLEGIVHPIVHRRRAELREKYQHDQQVVAIVEDTPLLLEKHLEDQVDVIVYVHADAAIRAARVAGRGWSEGEIARREKNQLSLDIKRNRADYVIDNNAGETESLSHVRRVLSQILHRDRGK